MSATIIFWGVLAAILAVLFPNTKDISEWYNKREPRSAGQKTRLAYSLGGLSGIAATCAFFASLSLSQSPFLYFNF